MDNRKAWTYRDCEITPEVGESRYFGHPNFKPDMGQPLNHTRWWKVHYPAGGYILVATKAEVRGLIDDAIISHPLKFEKP